MGGNRIRKLAIIRRSYISTMLRIAAFVKYDKYKGSLILEMSQYKVRIRVVRDASKSPYLLLSYLRSTAVDNRGNLISYQTCNGLKKCTSKSVKRKDN